MVTRFNGSASVSASASVGSRASAASAATSSLIRRPVSTLYYFVEIKSVTQAIFSECSPIQIETEVYEYKEGGRNTHVHRLPGRAKISNITLKRGIALKRAGASFVYQTGQAPWANELWGWYAQILQGNIKRHNMSIILFNDAMGQSVARWNLIGAYPIKWIGPTFKAGESSIAVETLELAHAGILLD